MKLVTYLYVMPMLVILAAGLLRLVFRPSSFPRNRFGLWRAVLPIVTISLVPAVNFLFAIFELHWLVVTFSPRKWYFRVKYGR